MSRSQHYRICEKCTPDAPCEFHSPHYWSYILGRYIDSHSSYLHKPIREIHGRRSWKRQPRYPGYSIKQWHSSPPRWWWQEQHAKVRQIHRQMIIHQEDPALPSEKELINLYGWY